MIYGNIPLEKMVVDLSLEQMVVYLPLKQTVVRKLPLLWKGGDLEVYAW
jgi:hypothetical protein